MVISRRFGPLVLLISVGFLAPIYACSDDDTEDVADASGLDASRNDGNEPTMDSSPATTADSSPNDSSPLDSSRVDSSTHDASTADADAQIPIEYTATPTTFSYYITGNHDLSTFVKQ